MLTHGLLVRLEGAPEQDEALERFLFSARALVRREPGTAAWFALRFGRCEYGIFGAFPHEDGRQAHLGGGGVAALMANAGRLLRAAPDIQKIDILASLLPRVPAEVTRGLLLAFKPHRGHEDRVEQFLRDALPLVEDEPGTLAWFALRLPNGEYGIFDVFADNAGRFAHLTGHVPRELTKHALSLLGGLPDMDMPRVLASYFAAPMPAAAAAARAGTGMGTGTGTGMGML